ncbi:putative RNA-dependent RNA polymerase, mitoviral (mitochondrion) [Arabidopsis thaliana]
MAVRCSKIQRTDGRPGHSLQPAKVSFVAGQPLGYYSSWPLFALSHHMVVCRNFLLVRCSPIQVWKYSMNTLCTMHGWMKLYLEYQRWNCMLRLSASIELEVFMDVPIFIRTYYRPANMDDSFRYGIIFRMYDLAVQLQWGNVMKLLLVTKTQVEKKKALNLNWRLTEGHFNLCSKKIESIVDKALSLYKEGFAPSDKGRFRYSHRY